jgi:hypothetical protein
MKHRCEHYTPDIVANAARLADKIRALSAEGVGTAQIHRLLTDLGLRISYQDIRKVVADAGEDAQ